MATITEHNLRKHVLSSEYNTASSNRRMPCPSLASCSDIGDDNSFEDPLERSMCSSYLSVESKDLETMIATLESR